MCVVRTWILGDDEGLRMMRDWGRMKDWGRNGTKEEEEEEDLWVFTQLNHNARD